VDRLGVNAPGVKRIVAQRTTALDLKDNLRLLSAEVPRMPVIVSNVYSSNRGSNACSPVWTVTMRLASAWAGFSKTLNVSGTIADGTLRSAE
jgi:hypothetical protein